MNATLKPVRAPSKFVLLFLQTFGGPQLPKTAPAPWIDTDRMAELLAGAARPVARRAT